MPNVTLRSRQTRGLEVPAGLPEEELAPAQTADEPAEAAEEPSEALAATSSVRREEAVGDPLAGIMQVRPATCPGQQVVTCGNSLPGLGFPGERQVNSPAQDAIAPDRNITQSETSIAHFGSFVLMGFNDSNCSEFDNISGFAFSSDGGVTWSDCGSMPLRNGWTNDGDPSVAVDRDGVFYYGHISHNAAGESIIQLNTATVDANRLLHMNLGIQVGVGTFPGGFEDKEWVAVGPDPARPGQEAVYVTWTDFTATGHPNDFIRFTKLTTGVNPAVLIPPTNIVTTVRRGVQGSFPVIDRNTGALYVIYEDVPVAPNPRTVRLVTSTNGGQNFSGPIVISDFVSGSTDVVQCDNQRREVILVAPGKAIRQLNFPQGAVGPDGTVYAVWNDGRNLAAGHIDIFLAFSTNGGATWSRVQITNGPTHAFFPSVTVDAAGAHIQYSKFCGPGTGVGNGTFALFKRHFVRPNTLSAEEMVSTVCSEVPDNQPTNFDTGIAGCYMGDYNQIITGDFGALLHAWGDNRNDPRGDNPDVFFIQQGGLTPSEVDCILVDKVYDFCFEEDTGLQHCVPIPPDCGIPTGSTATCTITNVECTAGAPVPTGVDGLSTVRVTITTTYDTVIRNPGGTAVCVIRGSIFTFTKTVTVCGPAGTTADCEVRAATCGPCVILPPLDPIDPPAAPADLTAQVFVDGNGLVCCEFNFCVLVETTAPVKILVPTFGFCTPARCQTGGFPPGVCPPSPLFPPQCAPLAGGAD